jgi:hypothetical protein
VKPPKIAAILLAAAILLVAIVYVIGLVVAGRQLAQVYEALEADQRPMTAADIIPAAVPSEDNAALVFKAVTLQLRSEVFEDGNAFDYTDGLVGELLGDTATGAERAELEQVLQSALFTQSLEELARGAARAGYWHDRDYSRGLNIQLPELSGDNQQLSRLVLAAAIIKAEAGEGEAAWSLVETGLRMALHGKDDPILIGQLVRIAQFETTTSAMQKVSDHVVPSASQASKLDTLLDTSTRCRALRWRWTVTVCCRGAGCSASASARRNWLIRTQPSAASGYTLQSSPCSNSIMQPTFESCMPVPRKPKPPTTRPTRTTLNRSSRTHPERACCHVCWRLRSIRGRLII